MIDRLAAAAFLTIPFALAPLACGGDGATIGDVDASTADGTADDATGAPDTSTGADTGSGQDAAQDVAADAGQDAGQDASAADSFSDAPAQTGADAAYDGGPLNGCNAATYQNRTNGPQGNRTIGLTTAGGNNVYDVPCMTIRRGQSVVWNMSPSTLVVHPLAPFGGDVPTPITPTNTGSSVTFTFANAGTYGFHCENHATMLGAIEVK